MAAKEETIDQISDQDVFNEAIAPEPKPEAKVEKSTEEPKVEATEERSRDEKGRFAPKEAVKETVSTVAETSPTIEPEPEKPTDHNIPSWRLKEEADARREAERRAQQFEQEMAQLRRQVQELTPKPEPKPFPDIFQDPESLPAYMQSRIDEVEDKWKQEFRAAVANMSMQRAHDKHGETFMEAFQDITARPIDDPVRQQVINSPDPGETLVQLFKRERTIAQVGDDPNAFVQKKLEEALNDPQFLAKALERAKASAGAQLTQRIDIPPSLNKATAAASAVDTDDMSDRGLYSFATRR